MADKSLNINAKSALKYALLPGIIPRAKELGGTGFGYLAFLFACVYRAVRILPANHAFVNPDNIGKFSISQVIAAAANNLTFTRRNIDQIIVFGALLVAVVLMFLQFILLILALFSGKAFANNQGAPFTNIFLTQNPQTDIAFLMLDYVFGIPAIGGGAGSSFFGSNALAGGPTPFQQGMHALFNFYNLAILLVGVLIFLYFIVVVVIETAKTGVPFGQRFSKLYAPFRLVFAIGLLVPLYYGFNGAQYITLWAAKMGSSFATNGWILYNRTLENPMGVKTTSLVAKPSVPSIDNLIYFSSVYHACREMYAIWQPQDVINTQNGTCIKAYVIIDGNAREFVENTSPVCGGGGGAGSYTYEDAKTHFDKSDMEIVLGEYDPIKHKSYAGSVRPYCGKVTLSLSNDNPPIFSNRPTGRVSGAPPQTSGIRSIEKMYYGTMQALLRDSSVFAALGERAARAHVNSSVPGVRDVCHRTSDFGPGDRCRIDNWLPPVTAFELPISNYRSSHQNIVNTTYNTYRNGLDLKMTAELERRGWGGAGIWYNNVADLNGTFTGAIYATPSVRQFPEIMEDVKKQRQAKDKTLALCETFQPNLSDGKSVTFSGSNGREFATAMNEAYKYFNCYNANRFTNGSSNGEKPNSNLTTNVIIQGIGFIFGINGLFDMRAASQVNQATGQMPIHPLAQLSTIGKSLVENAIRSMAMAVGAAFGGGMLGALGSHLGPALQSASGMFVGIATIGLTTGFLLYYILPFLPFIYFFFAVGAWVKSIFEAMVGVPLWALAHLHIDGDGFSGRAAQGGYFLILEIFLRPIVTLFGLIAGIAIFGAMAAVLNDIFDLVVLNTTGSLPGDSTSSVGSGSIDMFRRGVIDQFFFTIMYAILIYMMATASFKMIDSIPKGFMRWIGSGVQTFNDGGGQPADKLGSYAALGGSQISGQVLSGITSGAGAAGGAGGSLLKALGGDEQAKK
jgi:conjugal transfer/type IV secretion protein DotA/TraY